MSGMLCMGRGRRMARGMGMRWGRGRALGMGMGPARGSRARPGCCMSAGMGIVRCGVLFVCSSAGGRDTLRVYLLGGRKGVGSGEWGLKDWHGFLAGGFLLLGLVGWLEGREEICC